MVWNYYHDDDLSAPDVSINLIRIPADRPLVHYYQFDEKHNNEFTTCRRWGGPQQMIHKQYEAFEKSGQLELLTSPKWVNISNRESAIEFELPQHGVSLLQLSW